MVFESKRLKDMLSCPGELLRRKVEKILHFLQIYSATMALFLRHFDYKWTDIRESRNSPDLRSFTKYVWGGKNKTRKGIT